MMPLTTSAGIKTTTVYVTVVTNFSAVKESSVYAAMLRATGLGNASSVTVNVTINFLVKIPMTFPTAPALQGAKAAFANLLNVTPDKVNVTLLSSRRLAASAGRRLQTWVQVNATITTPELSEATQVSGLSTTARASNFSNAYAAAAAYLNVTMPPISNPVVGAVMYQVVSSVVVTQPVGAVPVAMPNASSLTSQSQAASPGMVSSRVSMSMEQVTVTPAPTSQPTKSTSTTSNTTSPLTISGTGRFAFLTPLCVAPLVLAATLAAHAANWAA